MNQSNQAKPPIDDNKQKSLLDKNQSTKNRLNFDEVLNRGTYTPKGNEKNENEKQRHGNNSFIKDNKQGSSVIQSNKIMDKIDNFTYNILN